MSAANSQVGGAPPPPPLLSVMPEGIPRALRAHTQRWAPWRATWLPKKGKYDKIPCRIDSRRDASTKDTWWPFDAALAAHARGKTAGIGFRLTGVKGLVGIDLDRCVVDGTLEPWARAVVDRMQSYAEFSPSGRGVRIFVAGMSEVDWTNHAQGIEVYSGHAARFLTVTGQRIEGTPNDVRPVPAGALDWLESCYKPAAKSKGNTTPAADVPALLDPSALPPLDSLTLAENVRAFLDGEAVADRSASLARATRAIYGATLDKSGSPQDAVVLSVLYYNPCTWQIALDHRRGDEGKALDYLWEHHCLKVRPVPMHEEIENLAANDPPANDPPAKSTIEYVDFASLAHTPPRARQWTVHEWLAVGTVTALFGPAGVGKSLLAEQLAIAVATGTPWLGLDTKKGTVLGLFTEDDAEELQRRASNIFDAVMQDPAEAGTSLFLDARDGKENFLTLFTREGTRMPTPLWRALEHDCAARRPALVILDNIAQLFAGNENDRGQATAFVNMLAGLAKRNACSILLLGHPAKAEGSEFSGSGGWEAAARTRLYLSRKDDGTLELKKAKANYSMLDAIRIAFRPPGVFQRVGSVDVAVALEAVKAGMIEAVKNFTREHQSTSPSRTAQNYLPRLMRRGGRLDGVPESVANTALSELIKAGTLLPGRELGWKIANGTRPRGLVLAPAGGSDVAPGEGLG